MNVDVETLYLNRQLMNEGEVWDGWEVCVEQTPPRPGSCRMLQAENQNEKNLEMCISCLSSSALLS